MVIGTDCTSSCKSNYHAITTAPKFTLINISCRINLGRLGIIYLVEIVHVLDNIVHELNLVIDVFRPDKFHTMT